jgi:ABC-2 type transport system ATP-binding protein
VPDPVAVVAGLTKFYGSFTAVDSVSFSIGTGEIFSLLGPNGAGKTTTIRMLMGILKPSAGTAAIGGLDCFSQRAAVKRLVGYLPDDPIFYDYLTGREILRFVGEMHGFARSEIAPRYEPIVARLELADALDEYAVNYSSGMKKKLALVAALLHDPPFLILDEPTNGLDPFATRAVHEIMKAKAGEGKSIFFSTHLLDQAEKLSTRVGILYKARLTAVGRLDELRAEFKEGGSLEEIFFSVARPAGESGGAVA